MQRIVLNAEPRVLGKKSDVKRLRREGRVPAVIYGPEQENLNITVDAKELKQITHTPNSYILEIKLEGKTYLAVFHDAQFHPVSDETIHVDFLAINENKPITISLPLEITGNAAGVKVGGKLLVSARKLQVKGLISNLPERLVVDVTELELGKQINAGDLSYEGVTILSPKSMLICAVRATRATAAAAAAAKK